MGHRDVPLNVHANRLTACSTGVLSNRGLTCKALGTCFGRKRIFVRFSNFASSPKHADWKPFAHLLGFDAKAIADHYERARTCQKQETAQTIKMN